MTYMLFERETDFYLSLSNDLQSAYRLKYKIRDDTHDTVEDKWPIFDIDKSTSNDDDDIDDYIVDFVNSFNDKMNASFSVYDYRNIMESIIRLARSHVVLRSCNDRDSVFDILKHMVMYNGIRLNTYYHEVFIE